MIPNTNKHHPVKVSAHSHFKRLGRELAMQYLYECDMAEGKDDPDARLLFWQQASEAELTDDERTFKKASFYAEKIIDGVFAHLLRKMGPLPHRRGGTQHHPRRNL